MAKQLFGGSRCKWSIYWEVSFPFLAQHTNLHLQLLPKFLEVRHSEAVGSEFVSPLTCLSLKNQHIPFLLCVIFAFPEDIKAHFKPGSVSAVVRAIFTSTAHILPATLPLGHFSDVRMYVQKRERGGGRCCRNSNQARLPILSHGFYVLSHIFAASLCSFVHAEGSTEICQTSLVATLQLCNSANLF